MLLPDEALLLSPPHCSNQRSVKRNLDKNNFCRIFSRAFTLCQKTGRIFFYCSLTKSKKANMRVAYSSHVDLVNVMNNFSFFNLDPKTPEMKRIAEGVSHPAFDFFQVLASMRVSRLGFFQVLQLRAGWVDEERWACKTCN